MIKMICRRLASSSLSIFILVTLVFFMAHLTPGGPAYSILGQKATAVSVAQLNARLGLDHPLWQQYAVWWWHLVHGQLGYSYLLNRPVGALLWQYEVNTLVFYTTAIVVSTALSILLGLVQGVYFNRWPAKLVGGFQRRNGGGLRNARHRERHIDLVQRRDQFEWADRIADA